MTNRQRFMAAALGVLAGVVASAGTLAVAAAGFALSFDAIRSVGAAAHIRPSLTWMLPVCVDGAMATAAVCAVVLRRMGQAAVYPWFVVVVGAGVSIAANALHAYQRGGAVPLPPGWAMAVSAVPPLLLALSVHLLVILAEAVRAMAQPAEQPAVPPVATATGSRKGGRTRRGDAAERVAAAMAANPGASVSQLARLAGVSRSTIRRHNGHQAASAHAEG